MGVYEWLHISENDFRVKGKRGASGKDTPELRLHCQRETNVLFFSLSLSFLNFYFIALSMLGTNIKLNICSIQTIKPLKKQTKNWNKTKTATVNIQDLFLLIKTFSDCFGVRISQPYIPSMLQPLTNFTGKKLWMKNKKRRIMFFSLKKKNST